jgi:RNA-directed DNA polymerase
VSGPKSFEISKHMVYEAYRRVRVNKGAAGVDGQSIEQFEQDLKGNLYKLWNRMSSGCYFPPPVRMVEVPKPGGKGVRVLVPHHLGFAPFRGDTPIKVLPRLA